MEQILLKETEKFILKASITPDKLKLFVDVTPPVEVPAQQPGQGEVEKEVASSAEVQPRRTEAVSRHDLLEVLKEIIKPERVNLAVLDDIIGYLQRGLPTEKRRIAKGEAPKRGLDGRLVHLVKPYTGHVEVEIDLYGLANYAELHLFDNISKGQELARIYPPKAGINGTDVFGETIAAEPGSEVEVKFDSTINRRSDTRPGYKYDTLIAEGEGYLAVEQHVLTIKDVLEIKGDLDYHYGNIDFIGSVVVKGAVESGFRVKARNGIEIKGSVRGGSLICPEGDIVIGTVLGGSDNSQVLCGKNVKAKATQRAVVECKGDIVLQRVAYRSQLRTQGNLVISEGSLIGGEVYIAKGLEAKRIGNSAGAKTVIYLCSDIRTSADYTTLMSNIYSHEKALLLLTNHLGPFAQKPEKLEKLKPSYREKLSKLVQKLERIKIGLQRLQEKRTALLTGESFSDEIYVNFKGKFFPGVSVISGEECFETEEELDGPASLVFNTKEGKFEVKEYKALTSEE